LLLGLRPYADRRRQIQAVAFVRPINVLDDRVLLRHRARADRQPKAGAYDKAHRQHHRHAEQRISHESAHRRRPAASAT
jgi:hypothetical protein